MSTPEILEQIKQLNLLIDKALNDAAKGQNIPFYKTLIQQNAVNIYQQASLLEDRPIDQPEEVKVTPRVQEPVVEKKQVEVPEPVIQEVHSEPVQLIRETEIPERKPVDTTVAPVTKPKVKIAPEVQLNEQELSLNDRISKNKQPVMNVADKSKETRINDLVKSIPIGKKFEFINGLFDGNSELYKTSLNNLQNASSYEEATEFLEANIIGPYEWEANEELAAEFFGLIKRRFS